MSEILHFVRELLRLDLRPEPPRRFHEHESGAAPFAERRPLYIGRGLVCLGTEPVRSRYRGSRD